MFALIQCFNLDITNLLIMYTQIIGRSKTVTLETIIIFLAYITPIELLVALAYHYLPTKIISSTSFARKIGISGIASPITSSISPSSDTSSAASRRLSPTTYVEPSDSPSTDPLSVQVVLPSSRPSLTPIFHLHMTQLCILIHHADILPVL